METPSSYSMNSYSTLNSPEMTWEHRHEKMEKKWRKNRNELCVCETSARKKRTISMQNLSSQSLARSTSTVLWCWVPERLTGQMCPNLLHFCSVFVVDLMLTNRWSRPTLARVRKMKAKCRFLFKKFNSHRSQTTLMHSRQNTSSTRHGCAHIYMLISHPYDHTFQIGDSTAQRRVNTRKWQKMIMSHLDCERTRMIFWCCVDKNGKKNKRFCVCVNIDHELHSTSRATQ